MGVWEFLSLAFPIVLKLAEGACEGCPDKEREAMVDLQTLVARAKAARKFGPRP